MRLFLVMLASLASFALFTGCAAAIEAETKVPSVLLPDLPGTLRVRILYARSSVQLDGGGSYTYQLKRGGKSVTAHNTLRVKAARNAMVFGGQSFKGEVVATPHSPTDALRLNGRGYRGILVFHPLGESRFDVV